MKALILFILTAPTVLAATIEFSDGRRYQGQVLSDNGNYLWLRIDGTNVQVPRAMVARIQGDGAERPRPPPRRGSSHPTTRGR